MNPLVKLAASAIPGERKYILFAGAGLSRDAGLPTAWDLMLTTAALIRSGEEESRDKDLESWFKDSKYASMPYAELIGSLFPTPVEQQAFIREKLRAERPGEAHKQVAELAKLGVIRCVITTNFDDLIEQSIENTGIPVQVIANDDDLRHSEPLIHCKSIRVYKPHGTLGVGRIRNTPADLEQLTPEMEEELTTVMSDHGLMVLGYSGIDKGILRCFRKRRQHRYPTFWINPSEPDDSVPSLFGTETYQFIPCEGASSFLRDLLAMYKKLADLSPTSGLPAVAVEIKQGITNARPDAASMVRKFMESFASEMSALAPNYSSGGELDELLVQAIDKSPALVIEFAQVAEVISQAGSDGLAVALYKGFSRILEGYNLPRGFSGSYRHTDFDFYKFVGHELFVTFFSFLIRDDQWELVSQLLEEDIYVENVDGEKPGVVSFQYVSEYVRLLDQYRNQRLGLQRVSVHADILNQRHTQGDLSRLVPMRQLMDADLFLFLRSELEKPEAGEGIEWLPWSTFYMDLPPKYLVEATRTKYAQRLLRPLGVGTVESLREKLIERAPKISRVFGRGFGVYVKPLRHFDFKSIGSR